MRRILLTGLIAITLLYALIALAYPLLREVLWRHEWGMFAVNFAPWLFAPLLVLVPLALFVPSWPLRGATALAVVAFLLVYGDRFLPRLATASAATSRLTVMTFNVHIFNSDPDRVATAIEHEAPDIVALQELGPAMAQVLEARLKDRYPYRSLHPAARNERGSGIFSRFPIRQDQGFVMAGDVRVGQHLVLDVAGQPLDLFSVHLHVPDVPTPEGGEFIIDPAPGFASRQQDEELDALINAIRAQSRTVLAIGDFNLTDQTPDYARLSAILRDAYREAGWGFGLTFPNGHRVKGVYVPFPLVRLDYVFHSSDLRATRAWVGAEGGSDHRYLVVELAR